MAITGVGVVAPNGIGRDAFWQANVEGRSGIDAITSFDVSRMDSKIAGQVKGLDPRDYMPFEVAKRTDRFVHLGLSAARMAIEDSGLNLAGEDKERIGVVIGSGLGGSLFHEEQIAAALEKGTHRINPMSVPRISPNAVSSHIAIQFGLLGPNYVVSAACASGAIGVGEAFRRVQYGETDVCVTGGAEAPVTNFNFGAYCSLRVLSKKRNEAPQEASRPFDNERDGFVMSEGAGMLILEEMGRARERGAHVYAEVAGYATASGAHHMVIPEADGLDAARAMHLALRDAGLRPREIDYINAHGTSTEANDKAETRAIKEVFGEDAQRVPISATKSMIGHTIGAAGAIEALVCALALEHGVIPPTINYQHRDPDCDLDYVPNQARTATLRAVLSNSFGFGSCNTCLVLVKPEAE